MYDIGFWNPIFGFDVEADSENAGAFLFLIFFRGISVFVFWMIALLLDILVLWRVLKRPVSFGC